jgi:hypothetical protein
VREAGNGWPEVMMTCRREQITSAPELRGAGSMREARFAWGALRQAALFNKELVGPAAASLQ